MRGEIAQLGGGLPVARAARELYAYLKRMDPEAELSIVRAKRYDPSREGLLWVGLDEALEELVPEVANAAADDAIVLDVSGGAGVVTGSNERSVLLAAYRLLTENGCAFLRPGRDGEIVPRKPLREVCAKVCEKPASRHRGVCVEGAVSYEHVADLIDWLPKAELNALFIQFFSPLTFFDRWYAHADNPLYPHETLTERDASEMRDSLVDEAKARGLMVHAIGHGWTCEPFGVPGNTWAKREYDVPEKTKAMFAEVKGKRELWGGVPLNTNLCYGNPEARETVTNAICDYLSEHAEIDYLHFWLADGSNNHCECPLCRDTLPSDFYVMMLNELDEKLTARGITTKIVFLIYVDLLWEPKTQTIRNPERFTLMFAPITRSYTRPFDAANAENAKLAPYKRNENVMPRTPDENVARLRRWQAAFSGDGFDFDYHLMWDHHNDAGFYETARVLMEDMQRLGDIGLNGMISCQNVRAFFPNALPMQAMAAGLWSRTAKFEDVAERYFALAYGRDGEKARAYLRELSERVDPAYLRGEKKTVSAEQAQRYAELPAFVESFIPVIERNLRVEHIPPVRRAWYELKLHAGLVDKLAAMLEKHASGDDEGAENAWEALAEYARSIEPDTHEGFDVLVFVATMKRMIKKERIV